MKKRKLLLLGVALALTATLLALVYSMLPGSTSVNLYTAHAQGCCGIDTSNEEEPPGDWDAVYLFNLPPPAGVNYVSRTMEYAQEGNYSYIHRCNATVSGSWAWTYITCTQVSAGYGYADAWVRFEADFGSSFNFPIMSAGDDNTVGGVPSVWEPAWNIYYDDVNKSLRLACASCNPNEDWLLDVMIPETWYHLRVEWGLPVSATNGYMHAWMGDTKFVEETGLTTDPAASDIDIKAFGIGVYNWSYFWCDEKAIWTDNIEASFCAPDPEPTPTPDAGGNCDQYGHAAVLNVDDDCSTVLRFNYALNTIPHDATVTRATLNLYGVALEDIGATIEVAPLVPLWGEMTCDWCRRKIGVPWTEPGAANVPLDRFPGKIAEFTADIGWIEVDIPTYLVEEWILTNAANPGLVLSSPTTTGKFSIASREWYIDDYKPYLTVWYED